MNPEYLTGFVAVTGVEKAFKLIEGVQSWRF